MDTIVFGTITVLDIIIAIGVLIGLICLKSVIKSLFGKKQSPIYAQQVRCDRCGWQGQVSKHAGRCPSCNKPLGDQLAKDYK